MAVDRAVPDRSRRPRARLREGTAPVRDRLLATVFLAALLHGIVILGVTFGGAGRHGNLAPGLDVLLVSDEVPLAERNDTATYLAQRTQLGSGTAADVRAPRSPAAANGVVADPGEATEDEPGGRAGDASRADERVVATSAHRLVVRFLTDTGRSPGGAEPVQLASRNMGRDDVASVELRGPHRAELLITPDTRESVVAPYLDAWRGKVERIGTLNYPAAARRPGLVHNPILEVTIAADGHLAAVSVRTSSGFPELDQAAIDILKLASPFDPFPGDLAARYATLRFAYEWQFVAGQAARGTLTVPADAP